MTDLPINPHLVARAYDTNKDGKVSDNLKVRQDAETLRAVGGDAEVTVDELANALKNDNVIIRDGEIQANPNVSLRVPLMLDGYTDALLEAGRATSGSRTNARAPERLLDSRANDVQRQVHTRQIYEIGQAHHEIRRKGFESLDKLQQEARDLKDPQLNALLSSLSGCLHNSPKYPDSKDPEINALIYAQAQESHINTIERSFQSVRDHLNKFLQPVNAARGAQGAINDAQKQIDRERQAAGNKDKAVGQLNKEIQEIKDGYNPFFRDYRMNSRREKIQQINNQVDTYSVNSRQDKVERLARQNYEVIVAALDGYDYQEGVAAKTTTQNIIRDANAIAKDAGKNADVVEDALD